MCQSICCQTSRFFALATVKQTLFESWCRMDRLVFGSKDFNRSDRFFIVCSHKKCYSVRMNTLKSLRKSYYARNVVFDIFQRKRVILRDILTQKKKKIKIEK